MRILRLVGVLVLLVFALDLVDGSSPFTPDDASGFPGRGSCPTGLGGKGVSPDAEFLCAHSVVAVPFLPSSLGPSRERIVDSRLESDLARGFVPSPFHPPRHALS
jgi:hypothetical protein